MSARPEEEKARKFGVRSHVPHLALLGAGAISLTGNALTRVAGPW